eukprot:2669668-Amphidinium_carterae.1
MKANHLRTPWVSGFRLHHRIGSDMFFDIWHYSTLTGRRGRAATFGGNASTRYGQDLNFETHFEQCLPVLQSAPSVSHLHRPT